MAAEHDHIFEELFQINESDGELDLDRIREHIIRCIVELNKVCTVDEDEVMKQHVFVNAVQLLVKEDKPDEADVKLLIKAFENKEETYHTSDWCPLHWAVALKDRIKEEVVRALFLISPTCLIQHINEDEILCPGFTPADLLVMQKNPNMSLVRYFDLQSPKVFTSLHYSMSGVCRHAVFPLHLAAAYSENLELLQYLIQTHYAAVTYDSEVDFGDYPLSLLISRADFPTFNLMLQCLLHASSDSNVIGRAIRQIILGCKSVDLPRTLKLAELLLNANPAAAKYINAGNETHLHPLGREANNPTGVVSLMKLLLVQDPSGLEVNDADNGLLPIHGAIEYSTVEVVKFMLQVYPGAIESRADPGLMRCAVRNIVDVRMVPYLCSIAPLLLHDREDDAAGMTPLARLCAGGGYEQEAVLQGRYAKMLIMCETDPTIVRQQTLLGRSLPLHLLIGAIEDDDSPTSDFADCFRLLLRLHPSAAEAVDINGDSPISYAIQEGMDDYYIRLLLSASTDAEHKELLSEYNHKNRMLLLFLSFVAISRSPEPNIFAMLRQSHREALKVVASFL